MKVKPTDDIVTITDKVRKHARFAACSAQLSEPTLDSSSEQQEARERQRPLLNGSSLLREAAALRISQGSTQDRKAAQLPLTSQQPGAEFVVLNLDMSSYPDRLARTFPWRHLGGV